MRIPSITYVLAALVITALGGFSGLNARACGPACGGAVSHGKHGGGTPAKADQAITYSCPMHSEVTSDNPGKCPKCGMFLEAKAAERAVYTCPMHPEVKEAQPGKCPKCGMALEKETEKVTYQYVCPMHSDVVSDKPGTCPKCGMFLEARPKAAVAPAADPLAGHAH